MIPKTEKTIINLDSAPMDMVLNRLIDIFIGDETVNEAVKDSLMRGVSEAEDLDYVEDLVIRTFDKHLWKRYYLESQNPEILAILSIPGEYTLDGIE